MTVTKATFLRRDFSKLVLTKITVHIKTQSTIFCTVSMWQHNPKCEDILANQKATNKVGHVVYYHISLHVEVSSNMPLMCVKTRLKTLRHRKRACMGE